MSMSQNDEIDELHLRCDNLQTMLTDLAVKLGQYNMAERMIRFHNEAVIEHERRRLK